MSSALVAPVLPRFTDSALSRAFDLTEQFGQDVALREILSGRYIAPQEIASGGTREIAHGLGRAYVGYIVTYIDADTSVRVDASSTADNALYIPLVVTSTANVGFWVF